VRVCTSCLVANTSDNLFCTACGAKLPEGVKQNGETKVLNEGAEPTVVAERAADVDERLGVDSVTADAAAAQETAVRVTLPSRERGDTVVAPTVVPVASDLNAHRRGTWSLIAALVAVSAGAIVLGALWRMQASNAQHLRRTLHATRLTLASTQSNLDQTKQALAATRSESEKRRQALVQTQDVLAKVDPLLSSVDGVQNKAGALGIQGETISSDAEAFITTVANLVTYLLAPGTNNYTYVNQQIDIANNELDTMRADESLFGSDSSGYGAASTAFGTKATAFTQSVRALQKQLKGAVGSP
jgi:hypothetical protein